MGGREKGAYSLVTGLLSYFSSDLRDPPTVGRAKGPLIPVMTLARTQIKWKAAGSEPILGRPEVPQKQL